MVVRHMCCMLVCDSYHSFWMVPVNHPESLTQRSVLKATEVWLKISDWTETAKPSPEKMSKQRSNYSSLKGERRQSERPYYQLARNRQRQCPMLWGLLHHRPAHSGKNCTSGVQWKLLHQKYTMHSQWGWMHCHFCRNDETKWQWQLGKCSLQEQDLFQLIWSVMDMNDLVMDMNDPTCDGWTQLDHSVRSSGKGWL